MSDIDFREDFARRISYTFLTFLKLRTQVNYPNLGEDLDEVWDAYFIMQEGGVRFANVKRLSHEVVKSCRTALMLGFPAAPLPEYRKFKRSDLAEVV